MSDRTEPAAGPEKPFAFRAMGWMSACLPTLALRALLFLLSWLGFAAGRRLGRNLRRVFERVLAFSGRSHSPADVAALFRKHLSFYVGSLVNHCYICRPGSPPRTRSPVALALLPEIERLRRRGKGVILATPHFGDLYSGIVGLGQSGLPVTVLMVTGNFYHWIEFEKLRFVEFAGGAADCVRALKNNEVVLVYCDLDFFPGNRTAEFFGAPAFPPHGPARLALATGAAIVPTYAIWSPGRVDVQGDEAIVPAEKSTQEELEAALLRSMERFIGRHPEQWMMFYDLWDLAAAREVAKSFVARAALAP